MFNPPRLAGVEALGPFEPGADQLDFLLRRRDAVLRFLLEHMQHVNLRREPDGVDRAVGVASVVLHHFQHPSPAETLQRLGGRRLAELGGVKRTS